MPGSPYPIAGRVYDVDGITALEGVIVNAYNSSTGKTLSIQSQATTNSAGEYVIDCANFSTGYSNGDVIVVSATKLNTTRNTTKIIEYRTTIDTDTGSENKDLYLTYYDVLDMFVDILFDNWEQGRTTNETPRIKKIFDSKKESILLSTEDQSIIVVYELATIVEKNSIGSVTRRLLFPVALDVRTMRGRIHGLKVRNEIERILNSKIIEPVNGYNIIEPDFPWNDLSDKSKLLWRWVLQAQAEKLNADRSNEWGA